MNKSLVLGCIAILLVLLGIGIFFHYYPLDQLIDTTAIGRYFSSLGFFGGLGFIVVGALFTALGLPRQLVAFVGGYTYGVYIGVLLGTVAAVIGAALTFYFARWLARPFVMRRYPQQVSTVDDFVRDNLFLKIITIRFLPFGTNLITNLTAGATTVAIRPFAIASFIGFIPQMAIFALTGQGVRIGSTTQLLVAAILFLISIIVAAYLYRQRRAVQSETN